MDSLQLNVNIVVPTICPRTMKQLMHLALAGLPEEVCGAVYHHDIVVQYVNTYCGDKKHGFDFELNPTPDIKAIWHSHPNGRLLPSDDDLPCMRALVEHGFNFHHIIVTTKEVVEYEAVLISLNS